MRLMRMVAVMVVLVVMVLVVVVVMVVMVVVVLVVVVVMVVMVAACRERWHACHGAYTLVMEPNCSCPAMSHSWSRMTCASLIWITLSAKSTPIVDMYLGAGAGAGAGRWMGEGGQV